MWLWNNFSQPYFRIACEIINVITFVIILNIRFISHLVSFWEKHKIKHILNWTQICFIAILIILRNQIDFVFWTHYEYMLIFDGEN